MPTFWLPQRDDNWRRATGSLPPVDEVSGVRHLNDSPSLYWLAQRGVVAQNAQAVIHAGFSTPTQAGDIFEQTVVVSTPGGTQEAVVVLANVGAAPDGVKSEVVKVADNQAAVDAAAGPTYTGQPGVTAADLAYRASHVAGGGGAESYAASLGVSESDLYTLANSQSASQAPLNAAPNVAPAATAPSQGYASASTPVYVAPAPDNNPGAAYGMTADEYYAWVNAPAAPAQNTDSIIAGEAAYVQGAYGYSQGVDYSVPAI